MVNKKEEVKERRNLFLYGNNLINPFKCFNVL